MDDLALPELNFAYLDATLTADCVLTDDPEAGMAGIAALKKNSEAVYLAPYYTKTGAWAYVDVMVGRQEMRGFIPLQSLQLSSGEGVGTAAPSIPSAPTGNADG